MISRRGDRTWAVDFEIKVCRYVVNMTIIEPTDNIEKNRQGAEKCRGKGVWEVKGLVKFGDGVMLELMRLQRRTDSDMSSSWTPGWIEFHMIGGFVSPGIGIIAYQK